MQSLKHPIEYYDKASKLRIGYLQGTTAAGLFILYLKYTDCLIKVDLNQLSDLNQVPLEVLI